MPRRDGNQIRDFVPLRAIQNRSLADQVFEQLASEIMTGRYLPSASLPAERSLVDVFGVNRHVVREALKRLEQIGLLKISQGGETKVLDFKRHAGLDLLALMAEHARGGKDVAVVWLAVLEMRAAIAADVARLCALRATSTLKDELLTIASEMQKATGDQRLFQLEVHLWERAVQGADNLAYQLAFNSLIKGLYAMGPLAEKWSANEIRSNDYRKSIVEAISAGDAARAETETRVAMREAVAVFAANYELSLDGTAPAESEAAPERPRRRGSR
ncbi:MAG TPA: GntR family transcriptional regulator [Polyangiaceae bacterium]|nr:GntR family transcriptional regulator [Polyangiaceae bacterium]